MVRSAETHEEVLNGIVQYAESAGLHVVRMDYSPITGPEGNIEFLAEIIEKNDRKETISSSFIHDLVAEAHNSLCSTEKSRD